MVSILMNYVHLAPPLYSERAVCCGAGSKWVWDIGCLLYKLSQLTCIQDVFCAAGSLNYLAVNWMQVSCVSNEQ